MNIEELPTQYAEEQIYESQFGDKRLIKRGRDFICDLIVGTSAIINRIGKKRAKIVGYHRFINNIKINFQKIMNGHYKYLSNRIKEEDLICVQDTSEYVYAHHKGIIKEGELGAIDAKGSLGLRVHPMLVFNAKDGFFHGISSLQIINRAGQKLDKHERKYKKLPIEEKESNRWVKAIEETKDLLSEAKSFIFVGDRESDIYQLWSRVLDKRSHLVIRTPFTRIFIDESGDRITPLSSLRPLGNTEIFIPGRPGKKDKKRVSTLEISYQKAQTLKPKSLIRQEDNKDPESIPLFVLIVKEIVPENLKIEEPIEWKLLTDIPISNLQDALKIIDIYKLRWNIEQFFRLTKQKGFALESSQLESANGLSNLIASVYIACVKIFQMVLSRNNQDREASDIFEQEEIEIMHKINSSLEGKSEKSKNPNRSKSLAFCIWVIARLGNWKPEDRDPPGPITFKRGWEAFSNFFYINKLNTT